MAPPPEGPPTPPAPAAPLIGRSARLNASTHIERGWNFISRGEHAAAEEELQKALKLVPDDTQAASLLGWAQMLQGKYDDALYHFHGVLQREPAHAIARVNVGYICLKKSIYGEAIEHLSRAIRDSSDRKATLYAHFYLGLLYSSREIPVVLFSMLFGCTALAGSEGGVCAVARVAAPSSRAPERAA